MLIYTFILLIFKLIFFYYLYTYIFTSLKMSKKDGNGVPDTFKSFIEKIKVENMRKKRLMNVELDPTLNHYIWNGFDSIQY